MSARGWLRRRTGQRGAAARDASARPSIARVLRLAMIALRASLLASATGLAATACGSSISAYCDQVCACGECSESARDACVDTVEDAQKRARNAGCDAPFETYATCAANAVVCAEVPTVEGCDEEARVLYDCAGDIGFGQSACDAAVEIFAEKYAECGVELPDGTGSVPSCPASQRDILACRADCVQQATCDAITGADGPGSVDLNNCLEGCP